MTHSSRRIVVGIDGSESSVEALRWAADQARVTGAAIDVITAWEFPTATGAAPVPAPPEYAPGIFAQDAAEAAVKDVFGDAPDVPVTISVIEGHARLVLPEQSKGADLLVVGRRGRTIAPGLSLGSVSDACARHAPCSVVIIYHPEAAQ